MQHFRLSATIGTAQAQAQGVNWGGNARHAKGNDRPSAAPLTEPSHGCPPDGSPAETYAVPTHACVYNTVPDLMQPLLRPALASGGQLSIDNHIAQLYTLICHLVLFCLS